MKVISVASEISKIITGRMSDGSDREEYQQKKWIVVISVSKQRFIGEIIQNDEPSVDMIQVAFDQGKFFDITSDKDRIAQIESENGVLKSQMDDLILLMADLIFGGAGENARTGKIKNRG